MHLFFLSPLKSDFYWSSSSRVLDMYHGMFQVSFGSNSYFQKQSASNGPEAKTMKSNRKKRRNSTSSQDSSTLSSSSGAISPNFSQEESHLRLTRCTALLTLKLDSGATSQEIKAATEERLKNIDFQIHVCQEMMRIHKGCKEEIICQKKEHKLQLEKFKVQ